MDTFLKHFQEQATTKEIGAKEQLLNEGEMAKNMYFVEKGCLRTWFLCDGTEFTFQFIFENQFISSFESLWTNQPSLYTIESIEPCTLKVIAKKDFQLTLDKNPSIRDEFNNYLITRLFHYQKLFVARISEKPETRYLHLIKTHPEILKRIPQHYIASYLGITPVSLSRIRNRVIN